MTQRLFANSFPRGGPFLLSSTLEMLGYTKYGGGDGVPSAYNFKQAQAATMGREVISADSPTAVAIGPFAPFYADASWMHAWLDVLPRNDLYIMGHVPHCMAVSTVLNELDYKHVLIIRDPRTLLLALLYDTHVMPRFLIEPFSALTSAEQLTFMWSGGEMANVTLRGFAAVYRSMVAWQDDRTCCVVRMEALGGMQGVAQQHQTVIQIADYLDLPTPPVENLSAIKDPTAHSFRTDALEKWEDYVDRELIEKACDLCADLAANAGYEDLI